MEQDKNQSEIRSLPKKTRLGLMLVFNEMIDDMRNCFLFSPKKSLNNFTETTVYNVY